MNKNIGTIIVLSSLFCVSQSAFAAEMNAPPSAKIIQIKPADSIPANMKDGREAAIQTCEKQYADVMKLKDRFDTVKKPSLLASSAEKNRYKNMNFYKQFFDSQFGQFAEFSNTKITLRELTDPKKLTAAQAEYTVNCRKFSEFITGFVDWATTGKAPKGMDVIYQKQIDAFKNNK